MPSLSTVYFVSIMVASVAGIASAFVGNMIHPIKGGTEVPATDPLPAVKPTAPLPVTPNPLPAVKPTTPLPAVTAVRTEAEKDAAQLKQAIETVESAPSASSLQDQFLTS